MRLSRISVQLKDKNVKLPVLAHRAGLAIVEIEKSGLCIVHQRSGECIWSGFGEQSRAEAALETLLIAGDWTRTVDKIKHDAAMMFIAKAAMRKVAPAVRAPAIVANA